MNGDTSLIHRDAQSAQHRPLTSADLNAIQRLQSEVGAALPAGVLQLKEEHELARYLDGTTGAAFGIFHGGALLAMALVRIPSAAHPNLLPPLPYVPLSNDTATLYTAVLEHAIVHSQARGRGYQRTLVEVRVAHAKAHGMQWLGAGAALANVVSWRNLLASGLAIVGIRVREGRAYIGLLRPLSAGALVSSVTDQRLVRAEDADAHLRAQEAGYIGTALTSSGLVVYQRHVT
jgi:GNAT superfamily N-acetyltransferase